MKFYLAAVLVAASLSVAAVPTSFAASTAAAVTTTAKTPAKTVVGKASAMTAKPAKAADPLRFSTEAAAQSSCSADTVVWANTKSKIFHLKGTATFAKGKNGVFMCEKAASSEGFKPTKKPEKQVS